MINQICEKNHATGKFAHSTENLGIPKLMVKNTKMHDRNDKNIENVDKI